jgi:hypothetical protein
VAGPKTIGVDRGNGRRRHGRRDRPELFERRARAGAVVVSSLLCYLDAMERAHDLIRFRSAARGSIVSQFLSKSSKVKKII